MKVRARVLQIRRRVAAVAVTVFIALFGTIYVQMAAGNDPALSTSKATSAASSSSSSSDSTSPVTTRQS
jgi:hypothetical protein